MNRIYIVRLSYRSALAMTLILIALLSPVTAPATFAQASTDNCTLTNFSGSSLPAGTIPTNAFPGATITTHDNAYPPMLFDTANPTGQDGDLGAPHADFGGPGVGDGGASGTAGENNIPLGMVLIISEDGNSNDPDDSRFGGTLTITYAEPHAITSIEMLDIDEATAPLINFYDPAGAIIHSIVADGPGDNSYQRFVVDDGVGSPGVQNVQAIEFVMPGSGAISNINDCPSDFAPTAIALSEVEPSNVSQGWLLLLSAAVLMSGCAVGLMSKRELN